MTEIKVHSSSHGTHDFPMEFWRVIYEETNFPNPFFDAIPGRILDRQFVDIVKLGIDQDSKRPQIVILIIGRLAITVYEIH